MRSWTRPPTYAEEPDQERAGPRVFVPISRARSAGQRCSVCPPRLSSGRADEQSLSRIIFARGDAARSWPPSARSDWSAGASRGTHRSTRAGASGEVIPTTLNGLRPAATRRQGDRRIGILRHMREYEQVVRDLSNPRSELQEEDPGSREIRGSGRRPRAEDDRPSKRSWRSLRRDLGRPRAVGCELPCRASRACAAPCST